MVQRTHDAVPHNMHVLSQNKVDTRELSGVLVQAFQREPHSAMLAASHPAASMKMVQQFMLKLDAEHEALALTVL